MNPNPHRNPDSSPPLRKPLPQKEVERIRNSLTDPATRQAWEEDHRLTQLLHHLPNASSHPGFTDKILASLETPSPWQVWLDSWLARPRWHFATAAALAVLLVTLSIRFAQNQQQQQLTQSVLAITRPVQEVAVATQLPPVEILQDFDAIDQMRRLSSLADEELLACLEAPAP
ncbi:MAG: hypothetical protein RI897_2055 [Verrucomicrobiota bacterium]|jgi:hypothetical protein